MNVDATLAVVNGILAKSDPALEARYVPAEDESVDAEIEIFRAGEKTPIAIQLCLYGEFSTNRYFYDAAGEIEASQMIYFGNNLKTAAQKAAAAL